MTDHSGFVKRVPTSEPHLVGVVGCNGGARWGNGGTPTVPTTHMCTYAYEKQGPTTPTVPTAGYLSGVPPPHRSHRPTAPTVAPPSPPPSPPYAPSPHRDTATADPPLPPARPLDTAPTCAPPHHLAPPSHPRPPCDHAVNHRELRPGETAADRARPTTRLTATNDAHQPGGASVHRQASV